jgi:FKBP-type peptidyl-prolyl cis-trans isomerase SlyD
MSGKIKKNDFIDLEYIGRVKDTGQIFDTNVREEAKKIGLDIKVKPLLICIGQNMILKAIDEFLIGKEIGKSYALELPPERAFGVRKRELVKTLPLSVFKNQEVSPKIGMVYTFDGLLGKIISSSGGRIIVDFNNPLAGREIIYKLKTKRKVTENKEKVKALMLSFFKKEFEFSIDNKKLIIKANSEMKKLPEMFKEKFKQILDLELEVLEAEGSKEKEKD